MMNNTFLFRHICLIVIVCCISAVIPVYGQNSSYFMHVKGQKSGDILGGVTQKGKEGQIKVFGYSHEITSPRDPSSGLPTGKRQHKPFVIKKEIDKATPLLYKALVSNENLTEVTLFFWGPSVGPTGTGAEVLYYTVKLTNANISSYKSYSNPHQNSAGMDSMEELAFTYQKIEWTFKEGGITAYDDWEARQ